VTVLVATVLLSVVAVGLATTLKNTFSMQSNVRFRMQADAFAEEVRGVLGVDKACKNTLQGFPLKPNKAYEVLSIKDSAGNAIYDKDKVYGDNTFQIASMVLKDYIPESGSLGRATLALILNKTGDLSSGVNQLQRTVNLRTEADASGVLTNCTVLAKAPVTFDCRVVESAWSSEPAVASCAGNEWVMSGGGRCMNPFIGGTNGGFLHESRPLADLRGWQVDCYREDWVTPGLEAQAYAVCCKK